MIEISGIELFRIENVEGVAVVTMEVPPVNAQNRQFREEIVRIFDILGADPDVRAIVLTGAGKTFSAGADLRERSAIAEEPGGFSRHNRLVRASFDVVSECDKPVIAAVNGAAIGAGAVLALMCDILIVSPRAFLAMTEVEYGLAGGVRHILRSFSPSDARFAIFTASRISGEELHRMRVASECVAEDALLPRARDIAAMIAAKAPLAVEAAKRSFGLTEEMALRDGYRYEQTQTAVLAETEDTREALSAFREKRAPSFKGR